MNTSLTAYTHLESLLLFQSLHAYGVGPPVFSRISELLKNNPHITADKRFQSGRLSPDALRNFYLHILKEEIRSERQDGAPDTPPNGEVKSSRKRKAPSPSLPTTQEAAQHAYLIPKLVTKLYARYRSAITEQIRDDEDRYERLQRELQGVERGEWDQQLQERANAKKPTSRSPSLSRKSPHLPQKLVPPSSEPARQDGFERGTAPGDMQNGNGPKPAEQVLVASERPLGRLDGQVQVGENVKTGQNTPLLAPPDAQSQTQPPLPPSNEQVQAEQAARTLPNTNPLPLSDLQVSATLNTSPLPTRDEQNEKATPNTSPLAPPNGHVQAQQDTTTPAIFPPGGQVEMEQQAKTASKKSSRKKKPDSRATPSTPQPFSAPLAAPQPNQTQHQPLAQPSAFQPPLNASVGYNVPPPHIHRSPYPPQGSQAQAHIPHAVSPAVPQAVPAGGSQGVHHVHQLLPQSGSQGFHQGVSQSGPVPGSPHAPHPHALAVAPPPSGPQLHPQLAQPYSGNGVPQYGPLPGAPPQFSPTHQRLPGPQSPGVQTPLQPRNFHPHTGQPPYSPQQPQLGQPLPQGGFMLPPFQVSPQDPSRAHQQPPPVHYPQLSTPVNMRQPPSAGSSRSGLPQIHPLVTQARQPFSTPTNMRTPHSAISTPRSAKTVWKKSIVERIPVSSPRRPDVLPIDDIVIESAKQSQPKARAPRKSRAKTKAKETEPEKEQEKESEKEVEKEADPDPVPEQPEEPAPEVETRQGRGRRKAPTKRRRLGSKASSQAGGSTRERTRSPSILSHTETVTADTDSQAGYQVKSEPGLSIDVIEEDSAATPSQPSTRRRGVNVPSLKRKRNAREASLAESEEQPTTPGLQTVIAPRHFSRMCNPIMNDIGSHKHSSIFTTAVKAKDAEGYYDIIKRPTDLKSIQKAIAVGAKVAAAAASDTPAGSPGGGGGVVELPMSLENIPPKAIVNSAQLEKELMRMFVNAVMFNAGEDGIVEDARQMFETVQQSVSKWRSIKQSSGRLEVEETPPVQEEDAPATTKRRKL